MSRPYVRQLQTALCDQAEAHMGWLAPTGTVARVAGAVPEALPRERLCAADRFLGSGRTGERKELS